MKSEASLRRARIVSSIAATVISLACGTNYVYSAWGPQYADRLKLSSTESNLVGLAGNFGMYSVGIPIGMFIDTRGPRPGVLVGSVLMFTGYILLRRAYVAGGDSMVLLCLYSFATGMGGCAAFAASIKTSALNWPHHRGTATAFPLAAFGLSAFFFSMFSQFVFKGDPGDFLLLLACGCFAMTFVSFFFLRVLPHATYSVVPDDDRLTRTASNPLRRTRSNETKKNERRIVGVEVDSEPEVTGRVPIDAHETSSLVSRDSSDSNDIMEEQNSVDKDHVHRVDIRGHNMLPTPEFWFFFALMGLLTGIGLMTINNIGNDAAALWRATDPTLSPEFIAGRQAMHVSILSVGSFLGRLSSGIGSDFLVKYLHASRGWCLTVAAVLFLMAQVAAVQISTPTYLVFVSSVTGLAYGFLFGVFPSLIAETFGVHGLSQNWGWMTISPVISGTIFNHIYGLVYDSNSDTGENGELKCDAGLDCYKSAYVVTICGCVAGLVISLWSIRHAHVKKALEARGDERLA